MSKYRMLDFVQFGDERGHLVVAEAEGKDIPFPIKRVFYMYGSTNDISRGNHANRDSKFVLINLQGRCSVSVDDGVNQEEFILDKPHKGLYLDNMVWKSMYSFSEDSLLLVLASEFYDSTEYINNFELFKTAVKDS